MAYKITKTPVNTGNPTGTKGNPLIRQTYHADEVYMIKGANGKPTKVSYEKYQMTAPKDRQRMSGADAKKLTKKQ